MVELRPAYEWTCEGCGRDNFEKACVPCMSEEDVRSLKAEWGISDDGEFVQMPESVVCPHCGQKFVSRRYADEERSDDD
jgi:rubredoxin